MENLSQRINQKSGSPKIGASSNNILLGNQKLNQNSRERINDEYKLVSLSGKELKNHIRKGE